MPSLRRLWAQFRCAHTWEYRVTTPPGRTFPETHVRTCTACGRVETRDDYDAAMGVPWHDE